MISHMELVGDNKVGILDYEPDSMTLARIIAQNKTDEGNDEAFMVVNLDTVIEKYRLWQKELPHVECFYAVKCNTDRVLVGTLASLGAGFDCASKEEIDIVMDMGVTPDRLIYANPVKTRSFIKHARDREVTMMTFDNAEELEKIGSLHPGAELILRIAASDPTATCPLSLKFGAEPTIAAPQLLLKAAQLGINVIGISFHVGSGCNDPNAYRNAIAHSRNLFDIGKTIGHKMNLLDMGGGFPGSEYHITFETITEIIRSAVADYFPPEEGVRLIAEPGRFFAAAPFTLVCNVIHATEVDAEKITKNVDNAGQKGYMYYLNDGVYGSFNCILFDHVNPVGHPLFGEDSDLHYTTIWGPTCDSIDKIEEKKLMPRLRAGDWMVYRDMGAYTCAASTTFNGFQRPTAIYVISKAGWALMSQNHI